MADGLQHLDDHLMPGLVPRRSPDADQHRGGTPPCTKATGSDSASTKRQLVGCTSGKRVIGTAADAVTARPVTLPAADPVFSLANTTLAAVEPEPFDNPRWSLRGHTICVTL